MLLAKRRVPIFITALIALFAVVLLFSIGRVDAGSSVGTLPDADFEEGLGMGAGTGWNWTGAGNQIKVGVFLAAGMTTIAEIEVFVGDSVVTSTTPVLSQRPTAGGVYPTGVNIVFTGTISGLTTALAPGTTKVGIHLANAADADVVRSSVPTHTGLVDLTYPVSAPSTTKSPVIAQPVSSPTPTPPSASPTPSPAPAPAPDPTPTPTTPPPAPTPPPAGDVAPGSGLLLSLTLAGLLLVTVGGVYMVGLRKAKR